MLGVRYTEVSNKKNKIKIQRQLLLQEEEAWFLPCSTFSNALSTIDSKSSSAAAVKIIKTLRHPDFMLPTLDFIICGRHQKLTSNKNAQQHRRYKQFRFLFLILLRKANQVDILEQCSQQLGFLWIHFEYFA